MWLSLILEKFNSLILLLFFLFILLKLRHTLDLLISYFMFLLFRHSLCIFVIFTIYSGSYLRVLDHIASMNSALKRVWIRIVLEILMQMFFLLSLSIYSIVTQGQDLHIYHSTLIFCLFVFFFCLFVLNSSTEVIAFGRCWLSWSFWAYPHPVEA